MTLLMKQLLTAAALAVAMSPSVSAFARPKRSSVQPPRTLSWALHSVPNAIDVFTSGLTSICRLPRGMTVRDTTSGSPNLRILRLYDIENSRECRAVRELLTELDLVVDTIVPSAPNSRAIQDASYAYALPENAQVPCMVVVLDGKDAQPRQETVLSGCDAIVTFLQTEFNIVNINNDANSTPETKEQVLDTLNLLGSYVAGLFRIGRGASVASCASSPPTLQQPLILYSYENNQFCRLVREVLTELDLPYQLRNAGKQSGRRVELSERRSQPSTQCPYLVDPNTDTEMGESADIVKYLYQQYGRWTPPSELLQWVSTYVLPLAQPVFAQLAPAQAGAWREDREAYEQEITQAMKEIERVTKENSIVVYTYGLSPFSSECKALLDSINVKYTEISLGQEWLPGLIREGGSAQRAALLRMTGQSSLPHIFVNGQSIGGLYSGTPGLLPALEGETFLPMVQKDAVDAAETSFA